jgi:hypothetical protein
MFLLLAFYCCRLRIRFLPNHHGHLVWMSLAHMVYNLVRWPLLIGMSTGDTLTTTVGYWIDSMALLCVCLGLLGWLGVKRCAVTIVKEIELIKTTEPDNWQRRKPFSLLRSSCIAFLLEWSCITVMLAAYATIGFTYQLLDNVPLAFQTKSQMIASTIGLVVWSLIYIVVLACKLAMRIDFGTVTEQQKDARVPIALAHLSYHLVRWPIFLIMNECLLVFDQNGIAIHVMFDPDSRRGWSLASPMIKKLTGHAIANKLEVLAMHLAIRRPQWLAVYLFWLDCDMPILESVICNFPDICRRLLLRQDVEQWEAWLTCNCIECLYHDSCSCQCSDHARFGFSRMRKVLAICPRAQCSERVALRALSAHNWDIGQAGDAIWEARCNTV